MITSCPVCEELIPAAEYHQPDGALIRCGVCGTYRLMERGHQRLVEWNLAGILTATQRAHLSAVLRTANAAGDELRLENPEQLLAAYAPPADPIEAGDRILQYLRRREPRGGVYAPLIGDRDYPVAGVETPAEFDYSLGLLVDSGFVERLAPDEAAYRITAGGWARLRSLATPTGDTAGTHGIRRVFLSHAAADERLASFVRDEMLRLKPGLEIFLASRAGDIRADEDWLSAIQGQLRAADAYLVLLTCHSVTRPWVWFETGAAWMSAKPWILARAGGLHPGDIPLPLSIRQTYALDEAAGAREVLRPFGISLEDADAFIVALRGAS